MDIDHIDILWRLISIQLTITIFKILLTWLAKICNVKDDPYLRIRTSLIRIFFLEIKHKPLKPGFAPEIVPSSMRGDFKVTVEPSWGGGGGGGGGKSI